MSRQFDLGRVKGRDFTILGFYPTLEELQAAVPDPEAGVAYGVGVDPPYTIYIWDAVNLVWENNGSPTVGPPGPPGSLITSADIDDIMDRIVPGIGPDEGDTDYVLIAVPRISSFEIDAIIGSLG